LICGGEFISFAQTIAKPDCPLDDAIENIDIGGPTMCAPQQKTIITSPSSPTRLTTLPCWLK